VPERLVIDASAAVFLATSRRGFEGLTAYELVAPPLLWSESLSALHQAVYRRAISAELAVAARQALAIAPITRMEPSELADSAWQIADALGWAKTYDAEYVALAHIAGLRLLTRDRRLARGAADTVRVVGPMDL